MTNFYFDIIGAENYGIILTECDNSIFPENDLSNDRKGKVFSEKDKFQINFNRNLCKKRLAVDLSDYNVVDEFDGVPVETIINELTRHGWKHIFIAIGP